jgi:transcriptional regulator with XRE-family HTH domain
MPLRRRGAGGNKTAVNWCGKRALRLSASNRIGGGSGGVRGRSDARSANDIDEHVGARLRKRRIARGLSQGALATILGVSFQQLHKYETGENRISVSRLYQLCLVLDVPLDWFFEGLASLAGRRSSQLASSDVPAQEASASGESVLLLRAYQNIDNPRLRRMLLSLAVELGDKGALERRQRPVRALK